MISLRTPPSKCTARLLPSVCGGGGSRQRYLGKRHGPSALPSTQTKIALNAELHAERASAARFHNWLHKGLAVGLGRQHKLSRRATEWIPNNSVAEHPPNEEDGVQGLTVEEQALLMRCVSDQGTPTAPMGAQREADEQRELWGEQWDTGKPRV